VKLLLVEDNATMLATLARSFERRGMQVATCGDGARALDRWRAAVPDVVVLDLSLPGRDGLEVLALARAEGLATPVLLLTARGTVGDRILGLNTGADDYLPKPFDLDELEARVRALARRRPGSGAAVGSGRDADGTATAGSFGLTPEYCGLALDRDSGAVHLHGKVLEVSPREAALLRALLARPGHAVARERLTELVFADQADVAVDAIEVVAYRLRKRLAASDAKLVALRGLGYMLAPKA
jgi:two-component system response regulator TctD